MELYAPYQSFFTLLRAGLWNREPDCDGFPLSSDEWKQVYMWACKQTVEGIVYDGIMRLPDRLFPPKDVLLNWVVKVDSIEKRNLRMNKVISELYNLFALHQIAVRLVKGQGVAACYDNPSHRVCGDIDWYFTDKKQFNSANKLIRERGISIEKQAKFSRSYVWKGFVVEHHSRLLDIDNPFCIPYMRRLLQSESASSMQLNLNNQQIALPSPLLTHSSVNAHILKHLLTSGVGIRQLCDSARVYKAYHQQIEPDALKKMYRKLGILRWIQLLNSLLVNHLGMPEDYLPFPVASNQQPGRMMNDVLQGGNFGLYGGPASKSTDAPQMQKKTWLHWIERLIRYIRYVHYAPAEACWNPVIVVYSHCKNWFVS